VLPVHATVLYPNVVAPILVGQERSVKLVTEAIGGSRLAAVVADRNPERRPPQPDDLYRVGTMATIHELPRGPDRMMRIAVHGIERVRIVDFIQKDPYFVARIQLSPDVEEPGLELEAMTRTAKHLFAKFVRLVEELSDELATSAQGLSESRHLAYLIASSIPLPTAHRQEILERDPVSAKLRRVIELLHHEMSVRKLMQRITSETTAEISRAQREHVLRKQMESIQRELGDVEPERAESRDLRDRLDRALLPEEARQEATRELERLERIPTASPEHGMVRTYLDWILKLPWGDLTGGGIDVERARKVLDEDHHDLEKVKERILEYLAVKRLREQREAELELPILAQATREALEASEAPPAGTVDAIDVGIEERSDVADVPTSLAEDLGRASGDAPLVADDSVRREPILCFVGPPGVGKTSLGQSIARAMGRRFVRMSLGGIHDEAEIRGHRRTYVGAMPGRILQVLSRAEALDPVFMLDEVDKLGAGFHGDPSAALLEVLDPAQNHAFVDNYLGVPFDLSRILFICTANTTEAIPAPLLDRMELLMLSGYTEREKLEIARRHVLPKRLGAHGLRPGEAAVEDATIQRVIREYTREAGVRSLERELMAILRKVALAVGQGARTPIRVGPEVVPDFLGPQRFFDEVAERIDRTGVATGLSWTPSGGDILFVEASVMPGEREHLELTGMLGDVMRESAKAALTYLRSNAERLLIDPRAFHRKLVHVHVPAGAIPKDGPSAGITILVALASQVTGRLVRNDVAMTGEITLRGKVLPVGGIKEKVLAAHRGGIETIILPRQNVTALEDVPDEVRNACRFVFVDSVDEALAVALAPARPRRARLLAG
jgi:ATP-dependent Lon protease